MKRPNRIEYFMRIARVVATRSSCERAKVGTVLVKDKRIIACGYNGAAPNSPHCIDEGVGCLIVDDHCIRTVHAEMNALLHINKEDARYITAYSTHQPCYQCVKALMIAGCREVFYEHPYPDEKRDLILKEVPRWNAFKMNQVTLDD